MTPAVVSILTPVQRPHILRHLAELSGDDLWLRFGSPMRQSALENYVNGMDFTSDRVLGIYDPELKLVGFTHVGIEPAKRCAELGISVSPEYRRRGYAEAMLRQALRHAANLDLDQVYVYFRTANLPMMRLARKAGFDIAITGSEAVASKQVEKPHRENRNQRVQARRTIANRPWLHGIIARKPIPMRLSGDSIHKSCPEKIGQTQAPPPIRTSR